MIEEYAVKSLNAMSHLGRLKLLRFLIQAGEAGMRSGDLAKKAEIGATTASAQLLVLTNAGLVFPKRNGREISYFANYQSLGELMRFLMDDCCQNHDQICRVINREARK